MFGVEGVDVEENHKCDRRLLTKMARQQEISNAFLNLIFVPTVATYHLSLANFGLEEKGVQVPHYILIRRVLFGGRIVGNRS